MLSLGSVNITDSEVTYVTVAYLLLNPQMIVPINSCILRGNGTPGGWVVSQVRLVGLGKIQRVLYTVGIV